MAGSVPPLSSCMIVSNFIKGVCSIQIVRNCKLQIKAHFRQVQSDLEFMPLLSSGEQDATAAMR